MRRKKNCEIINEGVIDHDTRSKTHIKPLEWCGFQCFFFIYDEEKKRKQN